MTTLTESQLRAEIDRLQGIQKSTGYGTAPFNAASAALAPLFRQMAALQAAGALRPTYRHFP